MRVDLLAAPILVLVALSGLACDSDGDEEPNVAADAADEADSTADAAPDSTADTAPSAPFATFAVSAITETTYVWSEEAGNLVFCRLYEGEGDYVWIRFAAEDGGDDGESAPHVDIDVCAFAGTGRFPSQPPDSASACRSAGFDVWWHDGPDVAYANGVDAAECVLDVVDSDSSLAGTFACDTLLDQLGASDPIGIAGTFECVLEPR